MKTRTALTRTAALCLVASPALAQSDFDFTGNFTTDDQVIQFALPVGDTSNVTIFSSSWDDGGFDPILSVFDSSGALVQQQDDGGETGSALSNGVSYDYGIYDTFFTVDLDPGDYTITIGQFDNFAAGDNLADGFTQTGNPNFTFDEGFGDSTQDMFNGVDPGIDGFDTGRTSFYEIHFTGVVGDVIEVDPTDPGPVDPTDPGTPNVIPTPTALGAGIGVLLLAAARRRRELA